MEVGPETSLFDLLRMEEELEGLLGVTVQVLTPGGLAFAKMDEDPTVYHTMNGPSEFHCIGSLKDWDITDRLPEIDIPTLLISGEFDEATPKVVKAVADRIPNSEWVLFEGASHSTHIEAPEFSQTAVCVDKKRQWKRAKNIWKNSAMRSGLYMIGAPFRLIAKPFKKKPKAGA